MVLLVYAISNLQPTVNQVLWLKLLLSPLVNNVYFIISKSIESVLFDCQLKLNNNFSPLAFYVLNFHLKISLIVLIFKSPMINCFEKSPSSCFKIFLETAKNFQNICKQLFLVKVYGTIRLSEVLWFWYNKY